VKAHVIANPASADPIQGAFQKILPVGAAPDICAPFLNIGILAVAELRFGEGHKGSGIHRVEQFLVVQRNPGNIDGLEPLLDLALRAFTFVNQELGI